MATFTFTGRLSSGNMRLKQLFSGVVVANSGFDKERAHEGSRKDVRIS